LTVSQFSCPQLVSLHSTAGFNLMPSCRRRLRNDGERPHHVVVLVFEDVAVVDVGLRR
jgi:hypothetical protein